MWSDILQHNRAAVTQGLAEVRAQLLALEQALRAGDEASVRAWLAAGRAGRQRFEQHAAGTAQAAAAQGEEA